MILVTNLEYGLKYANFLKIAFLLQCIYLQERLATTPMALREIVCTWAINRSLKMRGFLIFAIFQGQGRLDFAVLFFLSRESSDCIDAKISPGSLYSPGSSFLLSYLQEPKSKAVSSTVKDICVFYFFFDNFGQWEDELIQQDSLLFFLACL